MKSYFTTYDALAVAWATNSCAAYSHTAKKRMFTEHERIYSYGGHFCIARKFEDYFLVTERTYSNTTSKHVAAVCGAIPRHRLITMPQVDKLPENFSLTDLKNTVMANECAKLDEQVTKYLRSVRPYHDGLCLFDRAADHLAKLKLHLPSEYDHKRYLVTEHYERRAERNMVLDAKRRLIGTL